MIYKYSTFHQRITDTRGESHITHNKYFKKFINEKKNFFFSFTNISHITNIS